MSTLNLKTKADFEDDIFNNFSPEAERFALKIAPRFKATMGIWNDRNHNAISRCGAVMDMLREVPKGAEIEAFYDVYFDEMGGSRVWDNIDRWYGDLSEEDDWKFAVNSYLLRVLDQTFEGRIGENLVMDALGKDRFWRGYKRAFADEFQDAKLGVDIVMSQFGEVSTGVQVKPQSYFSKRASDTQLQARHEVNPKKYAAFTALYDAPVFYCNTGDLFTSAGKVKLIPVADVAEGWYFG